MELIRNLLNLNNRNFGSIEKFRLVENRLKVHFHSRKFFTSLIKVENFQNLHVGQNHILQIFLSEENIVEWKWAFGDFSISGKKFSNKSLPSSSLRQLIKMSSN
jgi:hypothetical protein